MMKAHCERPREESSAYSLSYIEKPLAGRRTRLEAAK
jgi:hypothetical protein